MDSNLLEKVGNPDEAAATIAAAAPKKRRRFGSGTSNMGASKAVTGLPACLVARAERFERRAQLCRKHLRVLPCGEVAALLGFMEVDDLGISAPDPSLRRPIDLLRKYRDGHRNRDLGSPLRGRTGRASPLVLPV